MWRDAPSEVRRRRHLQRRHGLSGVRLLLRRGGQRRGSARVFLEWPQFLSEAHGAFLVRKCDPDGSEHGRIAVVACLVPLHGLIAVLRRAARDAGALHHRRLHLGIGLLGRLDEVAVAPVRAPVLEPHLDLRRVERSEGAWQARSAKVTVERERSAVVEPPGTLRVRRK